LDAIREPEGKVKLLSGLADLYQKYGDNFQRALSFQPNSKDLLFSTAYACADADLQELALLQYEKLVQIDSRHSSALNNLGVVFEKLKIPNPSGEKL
jgi:tetratricopeptide (TPR) repeat protein